MIALCQMWDQSPCDHVTCWGWGTPACAPLCPPLCICCCSRPPCCSADTPAVSGVMQRGDNGQCGLKFEPRSFLTNNRLLGIHQMTRVLMQCLGFTYFANLMVGRSHPAPALLAHNSATMENISSSKLEYFWQQNISYYYNISKLCNFAESQSLCIDKNKKFNLDWDT